MRVRGLQVNPHCICIEGFAKLGGPHICSQLQSCIEPHALHHSQALKQESCTPPLTASMVASS